MSLYKTAEAATAPSLSTDRSAAITVDGAAAYLLQTTITLDKTWAKGRHTTVTAEKLWILVVTVSAHDTVLWYTSIPNIASTVWAKVPAIIDSIKVS